MPGRKNYTTPHVCVPLNNPCHNIPSEHDQRARQRLQSTIHSFHTEFHGPIFISVGPEAKVDMCSNFDLDKPFNLEVDPPSTEDPPLCRITQEGKDPILTTDFYFTNVEPRPWILPTPPGNKDTPTKNGAAATTDKTDLVIEADPQQPGEICLNSCMLYTPLQLIYGMLFTAFIYVPKMMIFILNSVQMVEKEQNNQKNLAKPPSD